MSESGGDRGAQMTSMNQSWIGLAAILIVGVLALISLYMGFQNWGKDMMTAYMYGFIGVSGFAAIGYMLFRSKPPTPQGAQVFKQVEVVTTLECPKCSLKRVRDFKRGDYIFKGDEPCTRSDGLMTITRIHRKKDEKEAKKQAEEASEL